MQLRFNLPFQLPGLNDLLDHKSRMFRNAYGGHSVANAYNDMKRRYSTDIAIMVRQARGVAPKPIPKHSVRVIHFHWREPDVRRDPDNIASAGTKLILDALQAMGAISTDGWDLFMNDDFTQSDAKYPLFQHSFSVQPKNVGVEVTIDFRVRSA